MPKGSSTTGCPHTHKAPQRVPIHTHTQQKGLNFIRCLYVIRSAIREIGSVSNLQLAINPRRRRRRCCSLQSVRNEGCARRERGVMILLPIKVRSDGTLARWLVVEVPNWTSAMAQALAHSKCAERPYARLESQSQSRPRASMSNGHCTRHFGRSRSRCQNVPIAPHCSLDISTHYVSTATIISRNSGVRPRAARAAEFKAHLPTKVRPTNGQQ